MRIAAGNWAATLDPEIGGAIASLTRRGVDVLRPTPAGATGPLAFASFPLVPYANRIADGAFAFDGQDYRLPRNHVSQTHPLHGVSWLTGWSVETMDATSATLVHQHHGDAAWPWRYRATQRLALDDGGLRVALAITSDDDRAMPVSLGFHPYFTRDGVHTLAFTAKGVWRIDDGLLPTEHVEPAAFGNWSVGATVIRSDLIDNCYTGWAGSATIARDDGVITLSATGTPMLHLYLPPGEDYFCAEPVSAMPDAVNRGAADILIPGERREITMTIRG